LGSCRRIGRRWGSSFVGGDLVVEVLAGSDKVVDRDIATTLELASVFLYAGMQEGASGLKGIEVLCGSGLARKLQSLWTGG